MFCVHSGRSAFFKKHSETILKNLHLGSASLLLNVRFALWSNSISVIRRKIKPLVVKPRPQKLGADALHAEPSRTCLLIIDINDLEGTV